MQIQQRIFWRMSIQTRWLINESIHVVSKGSCLIDYHYCDVIMGAVASQITSLTIVYPTVYSGADKKKKHQSSAWLAFVRGIYRRPVTGEFPAQRASSAENISIWWRHHMAPYSKCMGEIEGPFLYQLLYLSQFDLGESQARWPVLWWGVWLSTLPMIYVSLFVLFSVHDFRIMINQSYISE